MDPLKQFEDLWARCSLISNIHAYLSVNAPPILQPEELLRSEWVARVASLDLYVHELVAQRLVEIFEGSRAPTDQYLKLRLANSTVRRIRVAATLHEATQAFDLDIREQLSIVTYQSPSKIADGIRLVSSVSLWNDVAVHLGATPATKKAKARDLKTQLSLIVRRRNKIAHEGDLAPSMPREPAIISQGDLKTVAQFIEQIVRAIDVVVT